MELFCQLEVDVGEIDEDGESRVVGSDGVLEAPEFAVDARQVADDFGDSHDGHVFGPDDGLEAGGDHARTPHPNEVRSAPESSKTLFQ